MVHIYEIWTYTRAKLTVVATDSTERDIIIEKCRIDAAIVKEIVKTDNIIISKHLI